MKRLLFCLVVLLMVGGAATAETPLKMKDEMWVCGTCNRENNGDVCPMDDTPRPDGGWEKHWTCPVCRSVNSGQFCENDAQPCTPAYSFEKGDIVTFGTYPCDADGTETAPIEWIVTKYTGTRVTLVSRFVLDTAPYEEKETDKLTYERSSVRGWLNDGFLQQAFTPEEQEFIAVSDISTGYGTGWYQWRTDPGEGTRDKVFLLSYKEATGAFGNGERARAQATPYATAKGVGIKSDSEGVFFATWWLRSSGKSDWDAAAVNPEGKTISDWSGFPLNGIRPAVSVSVLAAY